MAVALTLALLGVSDEDIAADYSLSRHNLGGLPTSCEEGQDEAGVARFGGIADPAALLSTMEYLRDRYGGAEAYLCSAGLSRSDVRALRERLVDKRA